MRVHSGASAIRLVLCFSIDAATHAHAQPVLHVRASTRLELHAQPSANQVRLEGTLVDDLDQPLEGRSVLLTLEAADDSSPSDAASRTLRTDRAGRFTQALTRGTGHYTLHASFAGDSLHEGTIFSQTFDVTRADVQLQLVLPRGHVIALDDATTEFEVRATSPAGASRLPCELRDETGRQLARGETDDQGVWRGALANDALGQPGPGQWMASSAEDAEHAAGRTRVSVLRQRATELKLTAASFALKQVAIGDPAEGREREGIQVAGALRTRSGPLANAAIGLYLDSEHAHTVITNANGEFQHVLPFERTAEALVRHVSARFDPDNPGLIGSRSTERAVTIPARPGPSLWWIALPSLLTLAFSWLFARRNVWFGARPPVPVTRAGVQLGAARRRAPSQHGLDGVIQDADTASPIARAALRVVRSDGREASASVQPDGSFSIPQLEPGAYRLESRAPGYALEATEVRIPHAGEGNGLRVRLRSLRTLALEAHRPILRRVFPAREQQHTATVRETLRNAPVEWAGPALERLSALVEHTAYAPDEPTVEHVKAIEVHADQLLEPRDR
jgi:Carboxypeptidase regulatory-like domain